MSDEMSPEEILQFVNQQQADQNLDASLEQVLMRHILNPTRLKSTRTVLVDVNSDGVIFETREGTVLNPAGFIEEIKEDRFFMLDDGTSTSPSGITRCGTCQGVVKEQNLRRCPCGKTCCVRQGCGQSVDGSTETLYCSGWHSFFGWLGFGLR